MIMTNNRSTLRYFYYAFILVILGFFFGTAYVAVDLLSFYIKYIQLLYGSVTALLLGGFAIFAAVLSLVVATFGCIGIQRLSGQTIVLYSIALIISMFVNTGLTIASFSLENSERSAHLRSMSSTIVLYDELFINDVRNAWDSVQNTYNCCGATGPSDWDIIYYSEKLPQSCCTSNFANCKPSSVYVKFNGCFEPLMEHLESKIHTMAAISLAFTIFHIPGLAIAYFANRLARKNAL
ncbi:tetraspanin-6-like [Condylostylus longicornis]|uniref:tetraspanin-6-like n=1 Tax=Condylostylus longicornis TaxID=2530218 RepID=UPI00244DEE45|nr:tetraspanin-6-like [Condylostylus longicornis]